MNSLCFTLTERVPQLLEADQCTLYLVDNKHKELWTLSGGVQIRIPIDKGIAGITATKGEIVNIPDAYKDDRWGGQDFDKKSGYHTKSILCLPIKEETDQGETRIVGVLQLINKAGGPFDLGDCNLLEGFLGICAGIISSSQLFNQSSGRERKGTEFSDLDGTSAAAQKMQAMPTFAEGAEDDSDEDDGDF